MNFIKFCVLSFIGTFILYLSGWKAPHSYDLSIENLIAIKFFGGYVSDSLIIYSYGFLINVNDLWYGMTIDYERFLDSPFISWFGFGFACSFYAKALTGLFESR